MEYWIRRASSSGYIWEGDSVEDATYPCSKSFAVPVAGGHHRFKIEISCLEDLISLQQEVADSLVISKDSITIYDDYIE